MCEVVLLDPSGVAQSHLSAMVEGSQSDVAQRDLCEMHNTALHHAFEG